MTKPILLAFMLAVMVCVVNAQAYNRTVSTPYLAIDNFTMPSNVSLFYPLPISFSIANIGQAASNDILVDIRINGPYYSNTTFYTTSLSPGQNETVLAYMPNSTSEIGAYFVYVNVSYVMGGTKYRTGFGSQYNVSYSQYAVRPKGVGDITLPPGINITYLPYVTYMSQSSSFSTRLGIRNLASNAIFVNVSVPSRLSSTLSFSTQVLYLSPNQSVISNLLFNPINGAPPGTYIMPVTITKLGTGSIPAQRRTEYLNFYTFSNSSTTPSLYNQIYLGNNTGSAGGTIQVYAPIAYGLADTVVKLIFNSSLASNVSQLNAYGAAENITSQGGSYVVQWHVDSLPKGQTKYLYYGVSGIGNMNALKGAELVLFSSNPVANQNLFKLVSTSLPAFYTSIPGNVSISILYTGTGPGKVELSLIGPPGSFVNNVTRLVNVTPNQVFTSRFSVDMGNTTGTGYLTLSVSSGGTSTTYSLPVIVLQSSPSVSSILSTQVPLFKYIPIIIAVLALIILLMRGRLLSKVQQPYRPEVARKLIGMREQIKNSRSRK